MLISLFSAQMYVLVKGTLPMDVGFMYADTMEQLRPKMTLYKTFPEAASAVDEMMAAVAREGELSPEVLLRGCADASSCLRSAGPADEEVDENDGREGPREGADEEGEEASESEDDSEVKTAAALSRPLPSLTLALCVQDETDDPEGELEDDFDEEEAGGSRGRDPNAMTQDEEDEFSRELAKMMVSNSENRKVAERKPVSLDVGLPLIRRSRQVTEDDIDGDDVPQKKGMQFTLLTKKGNKQQVRFFLLHARYSCRLLILKVPHDRLYRWRFRSNPRSPRVLRCNVSRIRQSRNN